VTADMTVSHGEQATSSTSDGMRTSDVARGRALVTEGLRKGYAVGPSVVQVLDDVSVEVDRGEFVALLGRSGSGKSTLLHIAGGLAAPDEGRVVLDGTDISGLSGKELAAVRRRRLGFIFQFFHLLPALTVAENVALPLLLDGRSSAERVREMLEAVGLAEHGNRLPGKLSGGEMQRVAVARALVARPALLVADEPTGNLDEKTGERIMDLLKAEIAVSGAGLLMATHDRDVAARADRVITLENGRIIQ
jgi:putative ABC transport system ATP-binding protein